MQGLHARNTYEKGNTKGGRKEQKYRAMKGNILSEEVVTS